MHCETCDTLWIRHGERSADGVQKCVCRRSAGGIWGDRALNRPIDLPTAQAITSINKLLEVIVAPGFEAAALELLKSRWKNVRLLDVGPLGTPDRSGSAAMHLHRIVGGYLLQERDLLGTDDSNWKVVSERQPTSQEMANLKIAWLACKHVKSNAVVIANDLMMLGSGAGQQDRVNACRIAIQKAGERGKGAVAASDAFFPFSDGPQLLLDAGITAIIHPGGSGARSGDAGSGQPARRGDGPDGGAALQTLIRADGKITIIKCWYLINQFETRKDEETSGMKK